MTLIMKNSTKKKIADEISKTGLNISDFEFTPTNTICFKMSYKPEPDYYFNAGNNGIIYCPGSGTRKIVNTKFISFDNIINQLMTWAQNLKNEIDIGDPWEEIQKLKNDINQIHFDSYEEMFTDSECGSIGSKLELFYKEVEKLSITSSQIKSDIEHLKEMTNKISKKDFMLLALGTIAQWVLGNIITPKHVNSVLFLFQTILLGAFLLLPKSNE